MGPAPCTPAAQRHGNRFRRHRQGVRRGQGGDDVPRGRCRERARQSRRRRPRRRAAAGRIAVARGHRAPAAGRCGRWRRWSSPAGRSPPAETTSGFSTSTGVVIATSSTQRPGDPVAAWQSVSVIAPLCVVAGSCATIAMLLEADAESFLAREGLALPGGRSRRGVARAGGCGAAATMTGIRLSCTVARPDSGIRVGAGPAPQ